MAKNNKTKWNKQQMLLALEKTYGVVTPALLMINLPKSTYYDYYKQDEEFRSQVDSIRETLTDIVEIELIKKIKAGDTQAILFYMKYRGKTRGYTDSLELNGKVDNTITVIKLNGPNGDTDESHKRIQ